MAKGSDPTDRKASGRQGVDHRGKHKVNLVPHPQAEHRRLLLRIDRHRSFQPPGGRHRKATCVLRTLVESRLGVNNTAGARKDRNNVPTIRDRSRNQNHWCRLAKR